MKHYKHFLTIALAIGLGQTYASIMFTTGTTQYNDADLVLTPSASVTSTNEQNYFFRESRAAMQRFVVADTFQAVAVNTIVRRAVEGATFDLHVINLGNVVENFYTPPQIAASTTMASASYTIAAVGGNEAPFGQTSGGITVNDDPYTTLTWTLPSTLTFIPGNHYAFILDGTSEAPGNIVMQYSIGNAYPAGMGFRQEESESLNFRSGNDYFGGGNNQAGDWGLSLVAIPEPGTLILLGVSGLALALTAKKNRG
ncbi:MAG: PEP-CTERM sorting domain-containing protein [Verrucomicrobia bacterium]|nr:PEP-CTERM sorting domain-containing protein [Verrucomicrobiota bacterium]MCH8513574.1 PEP-CTERM sorting domain-containing protein [Kiritimatiellia bacterium]